jgi:TonB family protein
MSFGRPEKRQGYLRRMSLAVGFAVASVVVGVLIGPDPQDIHRWLEHTGMEGDLVILDEIQIIPDDDPITQKPKEAMAGAMQGLEVDVEPSPVNPEAEKPTPSPREQGLPEPRPVVSELPIEGLTLSRDRVTQVEMHRSPQRSMSFVLRKFVAPLYPENAGSSQRSRVIWVVVAMYVDEEGKVTDAYTTRNDGGPDFRAAVLDAVRQWEYEPLRIDGVAHGFWDEIHFKFHVDGTRAETGG